MQITVPRDYHVYHVYQIWLNRVGMTRRKERSYKHESYILRAGSATSVDVDNYLGQGCVFIGISHLLLVS